jgi:hypothetical protein
MFCTLELVFGGYECVGSRFHVLRPPHSFSAVPRASGPIFMFCTCLQRCRVRRVTFSYFASPDSFLAVPRATGPVFVFCALGVVFAGAEGVVSRLMFCAPGHFYGGTDGVGSRFLFLRAQTHFRRFLACRVPFSYFAQPKSFPAVPRALGPVLMFCAPGLDFDGTECVGSRFFLLRAQTHFRRYRQNRVPCSCFVSRTCFRRSRVRRVTFSYFARPYSFSAVPREMGPVFMFCASRLVFVGTEGVGSRFDVWRSRIRFRRCRVRRVPFSYFARSGSFSAVGRPIPF